MIRLYQFPPLWGLPSGSPFCAKIETYLRMVGLPYETVNDADVRKAPKHKFPVIQDDGRRVADSGFIVEYLKATYGDPLDARLNASDHGVALALRRLIEEHLYWCVLYVRWQMDAHWPAMREAFFGFLPALVRPTVANLARKEVLSEAPRARHGPAHARGGVCARARRSRRAVRIPRRQTVLPGRLADVVRCLRVRLPV